MLKRLLLLLLLPLSFLGAKTTAEFVQEALSEGLTVDLRDPTYRDGSLFTEKGGLVIGPDLRIQAREITYIHTKIEGEPVQTITAAGDLFFEIGCYLFVGERLDYDFLTRTGTITCGRSGIEPWYFGGDTIRLHADGSITVHNAYITTSENAESDWHMNTEMAHLSPSHCLTARNLQLRIVNLPILWLPSFSANLDAIYEAPVKVTARWGGRQGSRLGLIYELITWDLFQAYLRADYRVKRGFGGGLITHYRSLDHREHFDTINYIAKDTSVSDPDENTRYRFQGCYENHVLEDKIGINISWDKLSDKEMATDYHDQGLELYTAGRTQIELRRQDHEWLAHFLTRVRVNQFQTIKQELPSFEVSWRPFEIWQTGIIADNSLQASYLDFRYANDLKNVDDYHSFRMETRNHFYRPVRVGPLTVTPETGFVVIFYSNNPDGKTEWLTMGAFGGEVNTSFHRFYGGCKHVVEPYVRYHYLTFPTSNPDEHFIFDSGDGLFRLNQFRFGLTQDLLAKQADGYLKRVLYADLYTYAFFDTPTIKRALPKVYAKVTYHALPTLKHTLGTAWNVQHNELDHINLLMEWTASHDLAMALEYRHRNRFDWRKVDHHNFILDSFHTQNEMLRSGLSDRRDTVLAHLYWNFHPLWSFEFEGRYGWNRRGEPSYAEYEFNLLGTIRSAWNLIVSYSHKEEEDRVAFYLTVGMKRPDRRRAHCLVPHLSY